jgi:trehalose 6-phosphate phosphatase
VIPILSEGVAEVVESVARGRELLVFDFEGALTSAPVEQDETPLRPDTSDLLRAVSLVQPCAVVSGQSRAEVLRRLPGIPFAGVIGNHGAEFAFGPHDRDADRVVASWLVPLWRGLLGVAGVELEDRRLSVAIHYRRAPSPVAAERCIFETVATLSDARVVRGNSVISVIPARLPALGAALVDLSERLQLGCAVHVLGTVTDERALELASVRYPVRVGPSQGRWRGRPLPDESAVDDFLRALLEARARRAGHEDRWESLVGPSTP